MKFISPAQLTGVAVFVIAFVTYYITLEPTTSFWDCSEFILSANKLEVNHPSGAPLFVLLGRLFTFLSFGNPAQIAWSVNLMSGFFSALTIFFLFHIIVFLARKISPNSFQIIGSAVLGSLTFAFSDSFWFSAVEGEVYALSMFFLVLCFWAILKWGYNYGKPENNRWILFIAIVTGLGLGVHLLNLLIIPSITMIVFFKSRKISAINLVISFFIGCVLLLAVLYALIPGTMWFFSVMETLFVNQFHLLLNSGLIFGVLLLGGCFAYSIYFFQKRRKSQAALSIFSVALILTGFSVYAVNLIRSQAGPPVNFGEPDNIYSLIDYLNREQYPKRPLLFGQNFNSPVIGANDRTTKDFDGTKYVERSLPSTYIYAPETCTVFPRMYSSTPGDEEIYKSWVNITGKRVRYTSQSGKKEVINVPRLSEHVSFFLRYQAGHMYWRYFMWNFVGRQNDIQGRGEPVKGNWISGIKPLDAIRLGPQDNLPDWMSSNRARNTYFFIPFLLGIIGMIFHFKKDKVSFFSIVALFFLAGVGLVLYINEIPSVPRERDYAYVGSFLAFSIWIGFSFIGIVEFLTRKLSSKLTTALVFVVIFLVSPVLLLSQNFDDHNRSNRYAARDFAANILKSCPPNAILFTSGDNDTYPILYCQEVEGIRTDVRVIVVPFVSANWFINQLKMNKNESDGLKMALPQKMIDEGKLDYVYVQDDIKRTVDFTEVLELLGEKKLVSKVRTGNGDSLSFIPSKELFFRISAEGESGEIPVSLKSRDFLYKHELAFWDIVVSNAQTRPICFVSKTEAQGHGLLNYLHRQGLVYQLVPHKNDLINVMENPPMDTEKTYSLFMDDFAWGNIDQPDVYIDYFTVYNTGVFQLQNVFNALAENLIIEDKTEKAVEVLKKSISLFPAPVFQYNSYSLKQITLLFDAGQNDLGEEQITNFLNSVLSNLNYYSQLERHQQKSLRTDILSEMYYYQQSLRLIQEHELDDIFPEAQKDFETLAAVFSNNI